MRIAMFCLLLGCTPWKPDPLRATGQLIGSPAQRPAAQLLVVSDTHASNPLAPHALRSDDLFAKNIVSAAMRPPQLELWGLSILNYILTRDGRPRVTLHLGDAGNIACNGEFARFADLMSFDLPDDKAAMWIMAPGNHDSLLMGNWAYVATAPLAEPSRSNPWNRECAGMTPAGEMDKKMFLETYLARQCAQPTHQHDIAVPAQFGLRSRGQCTYQLPSDRDFKKSDFDTYFTCADVWLAGGIKARECQGDNSSAHYAWFIVQLVDLDDHTQLLVLDTTQYDHVPIGRKGALEPGGVIGGIFHVQLEEAETMLDPQKALIVAGHFPIESLRGKSRELLEKFLHDHAAVTYLSGHIHSPTAARTHTFAKPYFTELNFGSVMGWPMEYGYVSVHPGTRSTWSLDVDVYSAAREQYDRCLAELGPTMNRETDAAYYLAYLADSVGGVDGYSRVRNAMFDKLEADLANYPSSAPQPTRNRSVAIARNPAFKATELATGHRPDMTYMDPNDVAAVANIDEYERCQAIWASETESAPSAPSFWKSLLPVKALKDHYDDPPPAHAFTLRGSMATHESWHWDVPPR